jgi:hypothetical protein
MRDPHVRFDERDLETEHLLLPPRQISTLPHLFVSLLFLVDCGDDRKPGKGNFDTTHHLQFIIHEGMAAQ